ncbi:MAG: 23S rRNA (adenine(2503)-C(2))-methyltransferase RlmN [Oscillospiraceae bacterium]|nr:23S rRNA (adenine(2503)-C(2))-methyltransferase RlmN [Oscillospiraceae bacterium]
MEKIDIKSLDLGQLTEYVVSIGLKGFNAKQIYTWLHQKNVTDFEQMTNLSKQARQLLAENCTITNLEIAQKQVSTDGTIKYLYRLADGNCIETVLMKYEHGNSICVSSQVGCRMGCKFCASTQGGKVRDLATSEILSQLYTTELDTGERVSNIVLMGIGEPLDNFDNVIRFIGIISSPEGKNISQRNISLSTCGIVPKIYELAQLKLGITLSISLHATTNEARKRTMPVTNAYPLEQLMKACRDYTKTTGRRISFEYAMIKGENDTQEDAVRLSKLLSGFINHVNLIPVNPVDGSPFTQSDARIIRDFQQKLAQLKVNATIRRRLGQDISAACGQLRNEHR